MVVDIINRVLDMVNGITSEYITQSTDDWCVEYVRRTNKTNNQTIPMI